MATWVRSGQPENVGQEYWMGIVWDSKCKYYSNMGLETSADLSWSGHSNWWKLVQCSRKWHRTLSSENKGRFSKRQRCFQWSKPRSQWFSRKTALKSKKNIPQKNSYIGSRTYSTFFKATCLAFCRETFPGCIPILNGGNPHPLRSLPLKSTRRSRPPSGVWRQRLPHDRCCFSWCAQEVKVGCEKNGVQPRRRGFPWWNFWPIEETKTDNFFGLQGKFKKKKKVFFLKIQRFGGIFFGRAMVIAAQIVS